MGLHRISPGRIFQEQRFPWWDSKPCTETGRFGQVFKLRPFTLQILFKDLPCVGLAQALGYTKVAKTPRWMMTGVDSSPFGAIQTEHSVFFLAQSMQTIVSCTLCRQKPVHKLSPDYSLLTATPPSSLMFSHNPPIQPKPVKTQNSFLRLFFCGGKGDS